MIISIDNNIIIFILHILLYKNKNDIIKIKLFYKKKKKKKKKKIFLKKKKKKKDEKLDNQKTWWQLINYIINI